MYFALNTGTIGMQARGLVHIRRLPWSKTTDLVDADVGLWKQIRIHNNQFDCTAACLCMMQYINISCINL